MPLDKMERKKNDAKNLKFNNTCSICLNYLIENISILSCGHQFHKKCIEKWMTFSNKCPLCRNQINN